MADKMWFGHARGHMQYVPCPLIDSSVTRNRYLERIQFENGGGDGRRSNQYQMQYDFAFSGLAHEVDGIDAFNKYAQGFYGDDLIHLAHPAAFETNLFPAGWATPSLSEKGWGKISTDAVAYSNADGPLVTNLVTNPSMEGVTAGTDSTKRTNLVTNPSFETDTTGWAASFGTGGAGTAARVAGGYIGGYEYRMTWTTASTGGFSNAYGPKIAATVGTAYTYSVWVKTSVARAIMPTLNWYTSGSVYISTQSTTAVTVPANTWIRLSVTGTAPATAAFVEPNTTSATNFAIGDTFAIDAAMVEISPEARSYFDGTYAEDPTLIPAWTGTVNNSTSTALVRGASNRENLITNPSFEVNTTGWAGSTDATISRVTTEAYVGAASMQIAATANDGYASSTPAPATASSTYTLSVWVKGEIGKAVYIGIGDNVNTTYSSALTMTGAWQRITYTKTVSATTTYCFPIIRNGSSSGVHTFYVDAVMLEQSTVVNPYFDGSYTDAPGWATSWAGTANASRSVATAAPVTVRTNLVTNPSMETVTSGSVVMRRNLSVDPAATANIGAGSTLRWTPQWYGSGGAGTTSVITGQTGPVSGLTTAMRKTWTTVGSAALDISYNFSGSGTNGYPVTAGTTYAVSMYYRTSWSNIGSTQTNNGLYFNWYNSAGTLLSNTSIASVPHVGANVWTRVSAVQTAPANAAYVTISHQFYTSILPSIGSTFDGTGLLVETSSVVSDYFDGSTTDALGWDYAWSGTANASISTAACAATTVRTNLSTNPRAISGNGGWSNNNSAIWTNSFVTSLPVAHPLGITTALKSNIISGLTNPQALSLWNIDGMGNTATSRFFGVWVLVMASGYEAVISGMTSVPLTSGVWTYIKYPTSITGYSGISISKITGNALSTDIAYATGSIAETSSLGDYFDGSFNPAGDFSYAWTGTANASTSIQRGATVVGWTGGTAARVQARSEKYVGSSSLAVYAQANDQYGYHSLLPVTPSTTYTFSAWVKGTVGKYVYLIMEDSPSGGQAGSGQVAMTGSWQRISVTRTVSATATGVYLYIRNGSSSGVHTFYVDAVLMEASPIVQDYFDGSVVSADADLTNSWSGTAHASTSLKRGVGVTGTATFNSSPYQSTAWASSGSKSLALKPSSTSIDNGADVYNLFASLLNNGGLGGTFTFVGKIRLTAAQTSPHPTWARKLRVNGATTNTTISEAPNVAGVYEVRQVITVGTGNPVSSVYLYNGDSAFGTVWWDDFMLVAGTYTGDYFDGNSTDSGNTTYNWTGTANASTSTMLSEMVLYGNPPRATTYTVTNINQPPTKVCTLVIPPEYTLYLGASGTYTGSAGVFIRPIQASDSLYYGPLEELTLLDPNGSVRMNKTLNGATYQAVEIFLMKTDTAAATVTLNSMMAQLYKTGTTPALPTNHYQGEGSTGLMFADDAIVETYQYMHPPRKGIATTLIEVEAWR